MIEFGYSLLALLAGLLAGGIFFGGLWWTVQRLPHTHRPMLLVLGSMAVRLLLAMGVFYALMAVTHQILYLAIALVVFIAVRMVMSSHIRPKGERKAANSEVAQGELHATES